MNEAYLQKVLIYLQQELPEWRDRLMIMGGKLVINIAATETFQPTFELINHAINNSMSRVRNRETDLEFTVKSTAQERDFKIFK